MAVKLNNSPIYIKGTAEMWVHDIVTGDIQIKLIPLTLHLQLIQEKLELV